MPRLTDEQFERQQRAMLSRLTMFLLDQVARKECVKVYGTRTKDALVDAIVRARMRRRKAGR